MLMEGGLDMGHARALLALDGAQQITVANKIVAHGLSVREAEKLVQDLIPPPIKHKKTKSSRDILRLQERVADKLGASAEIDHSAKGSGKLIIEYKTIDQLDGILAKMSVRSNE